MVEYDSEYVCTRCRRRIRKGNEVWLFGRVYGEHCATIVGGCDTRLPQDTRVAEDLPAVDFPKVVGDAELFDV